jgi:hypothetical protein
LFQLVVLTLAVMGIASGGWSCTSSLGYRRGGFKERQRGQQDWHTPEQFS